MARKTIFRYSSLIPCRTFNVQQPFLCQTRARLSLIGVLFHSKPHRIPRTNSDSNVTRSLPTLICFYTQNGAFDLGKYSPASDIHGLIADLFFGVHLLFLSPHPQGACAILNLSPAQKASPDHLIKLKFRSLHRSDHAAITMSKPNRA